MLTRRSVLRGVTVLAACGLPSIGAAGSVARWPAGRYDAGSAFDAPTSAVLTASGPAVEAIRSRDRLAPVVADADRRLGPASIAAVDAVTASACIDRRGRVGGCAIASGSFDPSEIGAAVRDRGGRAFGRYRGVERFSIEGSDLAVAAADATLLVGYGPDARRSLAHVDGALDARAGSGATADARPAVRRLAPILEGDAVAVADLGPAGRTRLRRSLPSTPLADLVDAAGALGVGATVRGDRTTLRCALAPDPERVGLDAVRSVADGYASGDDLRDVTVDRRGRAVVVDAVADTGAIVDALASVASGGAVDRS